MAVKEKMTAPIASVGADVEQPLQNFKTNQSIADLPGKGNLQATNNAENTAKSANKKNPDDLETVSMTELYDTAYPPKLPIVDGLLYNGTYLFVGSPKIGKSFFMAQIGYHISKGLPLWGFSVRQGTVLYLALEDDYARLQKRLSQMFGMEGSENFYFATKSKSLNDGLEKQLVTFVTEHKDARLIIIDTLQKVREVGGDKFSYASDYEIVTKLKAFSDKYGICFLVVHHTRKMESSDSFDMISGTNGLLGAADGAFVMQKEKRTDNKAVLEVAGRDQQDQKLWLNFNRERCVWELTKTETELWKEPEDPLLEKIKELVTETTPEWVGTATELVEVLQVEMQPNALSRKLNVSLERLILEYGIRYKTERGHDGRKIRLTFVGKQASRPSRKGETWKENHRYRYQKIYYWHCSSIILLGTRNICRR
nr:AAA family ATPase [uncultured Blautia sp.]